MAVVRSCKLVDQDKTDFGEPLTVTDDDPDERGLFVSVHDKIHPDDLSSLLMNVFKRARIKIRYSQFVGPLDGDPSIFVSYK